MKTLSSSIFFNYVILGVQILNISTAVFPKLIFHQWLKNQLLYVLFWEFYIHSMYLINHCIQNTFNAFFIKNNQWFLSNNRLFLMKKHCSYFKYSNFLHTLNEFQIPRKEDQVVDFWVTDEIAASEILF